MIIGEVALTPDCPGETQSRPGILLDERSEVFMRNNGDNGRR